MTPPSKSLVLVDVPPDLAGYLAVALNDLRNRFRIDGSRVPAEIDGLQQSLTLRARKGHDGSSLDELASALHSLVHGQRTSQMLEDLAGAAAALKVSETTVKRLVASGQLRAVHVLDRRLFRVSDLQDFVDRLQ